MYSSIIRAYSYAENKHDGQMYGKHPYIFHCNTVAMHTEKYVGGGDIMIAALLHDVLEDTETTKKEIDELFGVRVGDLVDLLTNRIDKRYTFDRIRTDIHAVGIKLCDRLANVSSGEKNEKYRKEHTLFRQCLYRPREYDELWAIIEEKLGLDNTSEGP